MLELKKNDNCSRFHFIIEDSKAKVVFFFENTALCREVFLIKYVLGKQLPIKFSYD